MQNSHFTDRFYLLLLLFTLFAPLKAQILLDPALAPFYHGVASGDPENNRVILWTRVSDTDAPTQVDWQIATDTAFQNIVNCGSFVTDASRDYTVKVDADKLQPNTYYYYRFFALNRYSLTGRTRTLPIGNVNNVRLAVVSCARLTDGIYNVFGRIADRNDLNAVVHLGDYIYEYPSNGGSFPTSNINPHEPPTECISLSDYRIRYAQYHKEVNLRRMRQQHPLIAVWDDHETANNAWFGGAENHSPGSEGDWFARKAAGVQAYFEWLPIRENPDLPGAIYRKFTFGNLADLIMMDTRLEGRDEQPPIGGNLNDPNRKMVSTNQLNWVTGSLSNPDTQWKILGQQVMVAPLVVFGLVLNTDQWDGYRYQKSQILNHVIDNNIPNLVVLTGDIHSSWANDIPRSGYNASTGANSYGVEYVVSGATSAGIPFSVGENLIRLLNPHVKWIDVDRHGYNIIDVRPTRTQCEWYFVPTVTQVNTDQSLEKIYYVNNNERHLRTGNVATSGSFPQPLQAPPTPKTAVYARVKALLQGAYLPDNNPALMRADLVNNQLLPNSHPFTNTPPLHGGNAFLLNLPPTAVDWVVVELRTPGTFTVVDSVAAILHQDGTITGASWGGCTSGLLFSKANPGNYHIVIKSRNHIGVMSATPVALPSETLFDFTLNTQQAFGNNQQVEIAPGLFALFAGDCHADGIINVQDYNQLKTDADTTMPNYLQGDCNLDGTVDNLDFELWQQNAKQIGVFWVR